MSQKFPHTRAVFKQATYVFSFVILLSIAAFFENCQIIDDENVNAVCTADCTTITGRFSTRDGNTGIAGLRLHLDWSEGTALPAFISYKRKVATTKTDANGNYSIVFYPKDEEVGYGRFRLWFDLPDKTYLQTPDEQAMSIYLKQRDTVVVQNYHLPKMGGSIRIRLANPEAMGPDDRVLCGIVFKYGDLSRNNKFHGVMGLDAPEITEGTYPTATDQYTYIRLAKRKNGQDLYSDDSVMVRSQQTVDYDVVF